MRISHSSRLPRAKALGAINRLQRKVPRIRKPLACAGGFHASNQRTNTSAPKESFQKDYN